MLPVRILLVDDEEDMLKICADILTSMKTHSVLHIETEYLSLNAKEKLVNEDYDIVVLDIKMPGLNGIELMNICKQRNAGTLVLLITGHPTLETALEAVRMGAYDYITKPFTSEQFSIAIFQAIEHKRLQEENRHLRHQMLNKKEDLIVGESVCARELFTQVERVAESESNVLIEGETGTGKSLMAKRIHKLSRRSQKNFVHIDCGALPENLLESELFGYEKGSFTGAFASRRGLLEFAQGGTVFLDDVCSLPLSIQSKFLGVLQEKTFRKIGKNEPLPADVRVIAATNRIIDEEVKAHRFREDLYYRIRVLRLHIPSLRERVEDIPLLNLHFIEKFNARNDREVLGLTECAEQLLLNYHWPGNIRQLENIIEHAASLTRNEYIDVADLPPELKTSRDEALKDSEFLLARNKSLTEFEQDYFADLLKVAGGNVTLAAKKSGLARNTLYRYLKKHHIDPQIFKSEG